MLQLFVRCQSELETLQFGNASSRSDVWSYGVVLWEMFEFGKVPYQGMTNREAMRFVLTGQRLPKPSACPAQLYSLMQRCWLADARQRPSFQKIHDTVVELLLRENVSCPLFSCFMIGFQQYNDSFLFV